jgi:hypothetical protein
VAKQSFVCFLKKLWWRKWSLTSNSLGKHDGLLLADLHTPGFSRADVADQNPSIVLKDGREWAFGNAKAAFVTLLLYDRDHTRLFGPLKSPGRTNLGRRAVLTLSASPGLIRTFRRRINLDSGNREIQLPFM